MDENNKSRDIKDVTEEWMLYQRGVDYNNKTGYYARTDLNYAFYKGDQWKGVVTNGLSTPVFNIFKRAINFFVSSILSSKVSGQYSIQGVADAPDEADIQAIEADAENQQKRDLAELLTNTAELKWETEKMDSMLRDLLLDCACSGDMATFTYWDETIDSGQKEYVDQVEDPETGEMKEVKTKVMGDFKTISIDGCNVLFGDPNTHVVDKQPYILIPGRDSIKNLRDEAKRNGVSEDELLRITSDLENNYQSGDGGKVELDGQGETYGKALYIIKLWKKDGMIWFNKSTKCVKVKPDINMDIRRYPVTFGNWEKVKNSYHGNAVGTNLISNQIYINQQFAMVMQWLKLMAFGKVAYDGTRINSYSSKIGEAIKVTGDVTGAIQQLQPGQMNNIVLEVIDKAVTMTKDMIGANDSSLGNIDPAKASGTSIIATQKQAAIPLEGVQAALYQFVEDIHLIWAEFTLRKYTADRMVNYKVKDKIASTMINTEPFKDLIPRVKIDVGPSSYWSEIASMNTLDALLTNAHIDIIEYLDRVPNGMIPQKEDLIVSIKNRMEQQAQAQQAPNNEQAYEQMAQFVETLAPEIQQKLKLLPDAQFEQTVMQMMQAQQPQQQMM